MKRFVQRACTSCHPPLKGGPYFLARGSSPTAVRCRERASPGKSGTPQREREGSAIAEAPSCLATRSQGMLARRPLPDFSPTVFAFVGFTEPLRFLLPTLLAAGSDSKLPEVVVEVEREVVVEVELSCS